MALNHIVLMGRLTRDPEIRYTQSQKPVANFAIAVDRDGKDAGTDFIDIVAWNASATFVQNYFHKGDPIVISGRLQMRSWEDKNGNKRTSAEVVADKVHFVLKSGQSAAPSETGYTHYETAPDYSAMEDVEDGELPF